MDTSKLQREDHDTLIRLETKFDQMLNDIKEVKDGTAARLSALEIRMADVEKIHNEINPIETAKKVEGLALWRSNIEANLRLSMAVSGFFGAIVGFVLAILTVVLNLI